MLIQDLRLPPLAPVPIREQATDATKTATDLLNREIGAVLAEREAFLQAAACLAETPAAELSPEQLDFDGPRSLLIVMVAELRVREKIAAVERLQLADLCKARDAAQNELSTKLEKAAKRYVKDGMSQLFAERAARKTPEISALSQKSLALSTASIDGSPNANAIAILQEHVDRLRRRLLTL